MLVIYIALVFILLGVAFFALSTKTERRSIPAGEPLSSASRRSSRRDRPVAPVQGDMSPSSSSTGTVSGTIGVQEHVFYKENEEVQAGSPVSNGVSTGDNLSDGQFAVYSPVQELKKTMDDAAAPADEGSTPIAAVLFEDRDSVVSFGDGPDAVNPDAFRNLSRLCEGKLTLGTDSLTLRAEDTLYRFDFHRLKEVRGDRSSVLIFPDNMTHPLMILSPEDSSLAGQVLDLYTRFRKERQVTS